MFENTFTFWRRLVQGPQSSSPHDERRLWVRHATELQGNVQLAEKNDGDKVLARVRDLSVGGANLQLDQPMQAGQMVSLELPDDQDETRTVLACVVRVTPESEGKWSVGCVFSRELSSADVARFGARKAAPTPEESRTWVRYSCGLNASYRKVGEPAGVSQSAQVLNISANGIGLAVHPSLQAGALLDVDLRDKDGRTVRTILACVVHTTQRTGGEFAVGCNFIRALNEAELQALL